MTAALRGHFSRGDDPSVTPGVWEGMGEGEACTRGRARRALRDPLGAAGSPVPLCGQVPAAAPAEPSACPLRDLLPQTPRAGAGRVILFAPFLLLLLFVLL